MPSGGGGSTDATIYTNLIPTYIPGMQDRTVAYMTQAMLLSINNFAPYTGTTYAAQNAYEVAGINALAIRGANGIEIEEDAEAYLQLLFGGLYDAVNGLARADTYFQVQVDKIVQAFNEKVLPEITDSNAFSFGGSEHNVDQVIASEKMMDAINDLGEKIYYQMYRNERKIENGGLAHAIPYGQRGIRDAELLRQAGVYQREYTQQEYMDAWNKWNENNIIPVRNLDILGNAIRSILGTQRTTTTKYYKPPAINQIAGVALTGMSIYGLFRDTTMNIYKNPAGNKQGIINQTYNQPAIEFNAPQTPQGYTFDWGNDNSQVDVSEVVNPFADFNQESTEVIKGGY